MDEHTGKKWTDVVSQLLPTLQLFLHKLITVWIEECIEVFKTGYLSKHEGVKMNFIELEEDLDNLFKRLNEPYDVVPEWADPGVSMDALKDAETRLGVVFPEVLKDASRQFSGIYHETPYFMGDSFKKIQNEVLKRSKREVSEEYFIDDLEISIVYAPTEWDSEDAHGLKALNVEYMSEIDTKQYIGVDCDLTWLYESSFLLIGATYSESLYMDLRDPASNPNY